MKKVKPMPKVDKDEFTPQDLRRILTTDLKSFRAGEISAKQATTVTRMTDAYMRTMR